MIFKKVCKSFTCTDIFQTTILSPLIISEDKKLTDIPLFDAPTIVWNLCALKKVFLKIYFFLSTFGAPRSHNGLKLENPVYIDVIYISLKFEVFV